MTKRDFVKNVIDDVTIGGMLPFNVPIARVERAINDMVRKFRQNDDRATIEDIIFINTSKLGGCKVIKLPKEIKAITRLEFTGRTRGSFDGIGGINEYTTRNTTQENDIVTYASRVMYESVAQQIGVRFMPYDYSEFTNELVMEGDAKGNLFAEASVYIPETALYEIDDFNDLCEAEITLEFVRVNSFIKTKLIGGREIDWEAMKENAQTILDNIKEKWDDQGGEGVMMLD